MIDDRLLPLAKRLADLSVDDIWHFYRNVHLERELGIFSAAETAKVFDYKSGFGNLLTRFAYYRQAYCRPLYRAVCTIFRRYEQPCILDVCCGTGTQAILFSLLGASIVGLDYDPGQLGAMQQRLVFYERYFPSRLNIKLKMADVRCQDFAALGLFDVVYSHIGIGRLLSADDIFQRVSACLRPGGLVILKNGNPQCLWLRAVGIRPADSPRAEYLHSARVYGFTPLVVRGTTAIPRPLWFFGRATCLLDTLLSSVLPLQLGIEYIFEKHG